MQLVAEHHRSQKCITYFYVPSLCLLLIGRLLSWYSLDSVQTLHYSVKLMHKYM